MSIVKRAPEDLKVALGQCFWIGINGTTVEDSATQEIFRHFQPGGIILFQRNVESIDQVRRLNADLQSRAKIPLLLAVDQEGGTVERLHHLIGTIPPAMALAAARSKSLIRRVHGAHARLLAALGFNVNFTPVLDLALSHINNGLGTRCFSDDPRTVTACAREVIRAHQKAGVLVCGKHFPGLGDTDLDSHVDLPIVPRSWKRIQKEDLYPYKKLLKDLPFIMVNHALYPELNRKLPASLAKEATKEFLLNNWNYPGLAISDDLYMGAVSSLYNLPEAAEHALRAGNHLFLICRPEGVVETYKKLLSRAKGSALADAIFRSGSRILSFKFQSLMAPHAGHRIGKEIRQLQKFSAEVSGRAITFLHGKPIRKVPDSCTVYLSRTKWITEEQSALGKYFTDRGCRVREHVFVADLSEEQARTLAAQSETEWNFLVLANAAQNLGQRKLLKELIRLDRQVAVISGAFPADSIPEEVQAAVACYWTSPSALLSSGRALIGERKARGKLPLNIGNK